MNGCFFAVEIFPLDFLLFSIPFDIPIERSPISSQTKSKKSRRFLLLCAASTIKCIEFDSDRYMYAHARANIDKHLKTLT